MSKQYCRFAGQTAALDSHPNNLRLFSAPWIVILKENITTSRCLNFYLELNKLNRFLSVQQWVVQDPEQPPNS